MKKYQNAKPKPLRGMAKLQQEIAALKDEVESAQRACANERDRANRLQYDVEQVHMILDTLYTKGVVPRNGPTYRYPGDNSPGSVSLTMTTRLSIWLGHHICTPDDVERSNRMPF